MNLWLKLIPERLPPSIFPLNVLITNSRSLTLTDLEEFLVSLVCFVTDNIGNDSNGGTFLKALSYFTNISKKLFSLGIISSS